MSVITDKKVRVKVGSKEKEYPFRIESFDSAMEVAETCKSRKMNETGFYDVSKKKMGSFEGVRSYGEALGLLRDGYQGTVDAMKGVFRANKSGSGTRFAFQNAVAGFAPVVPLALKGVPNSMISMSMKPIKAKVIDIYYDMTNNCSVESKDIIKSGQAMLGTIIELERQGYRFNLYAVQTYSDTEGCDMLVVKVKSAQQPVDLKRISFPLTHTAFFRVIGFDWYSKMPGSHFKPGYGHALAFEFKKQELDNICRSLFGRNAVWFSGKEILNKDKEYIKEVIGNAECKA